MLGRQEGLVAALLQEPGVQGEVQGLVRERVQKLGFHLPLSHHGGPDAIEACPKGPTDSSIEPCTLDGPKAGRISGKTSLS